MCLDISGEMLTTDPRPDTGDVRESSSSEIISVSSNHLNKKEVFTYGCLFNLRKVQISFKSVYYRTFN